MTTTNNDLYTNVAAGIFGVPASEVTKQQRDYAKVWCFGHCYGGSANYLGHCGGEVVKPPSPSIEVPFDQNNYQPEPPSGPSWFEVVLLVLATAAAAVCLTLAIWKGC